MRAVTILILVSIFSFGFRAAPVAEDWVEYVNAAYHYKISYPKEWEQSSERGDMIVYFKSPLSGKYDSLSENLNVIVEDISSRPMDLITFTEQSKKQMVEMGIKESEIEIKDTKVAGMDAKALIYSIVSEGMHLKFKSVWFIKDTKAYLLTYTATPDQFGVYLRTIDYMVGSFQFLK